MAEDARCIELHLRGLLSSPQSGPGCGRGEGFPPCAWEVLDLASKHQILNLVGNSFSDQAHRKTISSWPTLDSQGRMMCGGMRRFNFEHLFDTHKAYLDPCSQVGAVRLEDASVMRLSDMASIIEQQIVPLLLARSENLQQEAKRMQTTTISRSDSTMNNVARRMCNADVFLLGGRIIADDNDRTFMCWNISAALHRVIVRTVLLNHLSKTMTPARSKYLEDPQIFLNLVSNLQTMIVNMQVASSGSINVIFMQQSPSDDIRMFLEGNEEILDCNLLFNLCSHPFYKMNVEAISRAVALQAVGAVFEACVNNDEMALLMQEDGDDGDGGEVVAPSWWLLRGSDVAEGDAHHCYPENLIPIVRLHPLHEEDNDKLCMECNTIFEDPGFYWPFLEQSNAAAFRGWVEFVVRETQKAEGRREYLCIKLLDQRKQLYS